MSNVNGQAECERKLEALREAALLVKRWCESEGICGCCLEPIAEHHYSCEFAVLNAAIEASR